MLEIFSICSTDTCRHFVLSYIALSIVKFVVVVVVEDPLLVILVVLFLNLGGNW